METLRISVASPAAVSGLVAGADDESAGILLVAFGTTTDAGGLAYGNIEKRVRAAFPGLPVFWAFTSGMVRKKLEQRGEAVHSPTEALERMQAEGIQRVLVQSLHVVAGQEFHKLVREVRRARHQFKFSALSCGRPLLFARADLEDCLAAVIAAHPREAGEALLLMAHGNDHGHGDLAYLATDLTLRALAGPAFLAGVEGGVSFVEAAKNLWDQGCRRVLLAPFMIVAGEHARNDLAGENPDSWKSRLEKQGVACRVKLSGLGEIDAVADIFVRHLRAAAS